MRRFYGKSEVEQLQELNDLLSYSMNIVDEPSRFRSTFVIEDAPVGGEPALEGGVGTTPTAPTPVEDPSATDPDPGVDDPALDDPDTGLDEAP